MRAPCVAWAFFCIVAGSALGGTCEDPGSDLTPQEYRNVKTACEQMAAAMAGWVTPEEGRRRLMAIQADNFQWWVPSGDPKLVVVRDREAYIKLTNDYQFRRYVMPGSKVRIFATTAQDNRVATEMTSDIAERRGGGVQSYTNRYHQLFEFNDAGKIVKYALYMDTQIPVRDQLWTGQKVAENFIRALSAGGVMYLSTLLTDDATWTTERVRPLPPIVSKPNILSAVQELQRSVDAFWITTTADEITVDGNRVAIAAVSTGADPVTHEPYRNVHHFLLTLSSESSGNYSGSSDQIKSVREYSGAPLLRTTHEDVQ
jgi:ketosteroid isomerase-like protein